jgi:hypothetical protein
MLMLCCESSSELPASRAMQTWLARIIHLHSWTTYCLSMNQSPYLRPRVTITDKQGPSRCNVWFCTY